MLKEIFLPVSFINDIFQSTDVSHFAFHSFVFRKIAVQYYTGLYIEKLFNCWADHGQTSVMLDFLIF